MLLTNIAQLRQQIAASSEPGKRIIVIGSGAVGLYTAHELHKRGHTVVVIEAGSQHLGNFDSASFESIGFANEGVSIGRSRTLGGTTNLWGGQLVEFQPIDFAGRAWMPGSRWPVQFDEISGYFPATYEALGLDRPTHNDSTVWKSVSMRRPELGEHLETFLTRWIKIPNFATLFQKPIQTSEKFLVLIEHTMVGFAGENGTIRAVKVKTESGEEHEIEGDQFVLAAGTIESCRLMLHAAQDKTWECPWRDNDNVGAYFQDHLGATVGAVHPFDTSRFFDTFSTIARLNSRFQPKIRLKNDSLSREQLLNVQGMFGFEGSAAEHLIFLKQFVRAAIWSRKILSLRDFFKNASTGIKYLPPLMWRYVVQHRIFVPTGSKICLHIQAEQHPSRDSRIRVDAAAKDRYGLPRAIVAWKLGGGELESIRQFAIRTAAALEEAGLAKLEINEDLLRGSAEYLKTCHDTYHQSGGLRMGESADDGVVDKNLKVFGTSNLYVGGSSTFRTISNANTTFTALAFCTRLVEHLCQQATATSTESGHHSP